MVDSDFYQTIDLFLKAGMVGSLFAIAVALALVGK